MGSWISSRPGLQRLKPKHRVIVYSNGDDAAGTIQLHQESLLHLQQEEQFFQHRLNSSQHHSQAPRVLANPLTRAYWLEGHKHALVGSLDGMDAVGEAYMLIAFSLFVNAVLVASFCVASGSGSRNGINSLLKARKILHGSAGVHGNRRIHTKETVSPISSLDGCAESVFSSEADDRQDIIKCGGIMDAPSDVPMEDGIHSSSSIWNISSIHFESVPPEVRLQTECVHLSTECARLDGFFACNHGELGDTDMQTRLRLF